MAFEAQLGTERACVFSPAVSEQKDRLHRAGRELLERLGAMLAHPRRGLLA